MFLIENLERIGRNLGDGIKIQQVNQVGQQLKKRSEFVTDYASEESPNEDMAESIANGILYIPINSVPVALRNMNLFIIGLCLCMSNGGARLILCKSGRGL